MGVDQVLREGPGVVGDIEISGYVGAKSKDLIYLASYSRILMLII